MSEPGGHEQEIADNRKLWDAWTAIHTAGSFYDVQRFRDDPSDVRIQDWERRELGDIEGRSLLHLQCHFGLDTLSWARLGASEVTGVDFSEPAIAFARELAAEVGLADRSRFLVSDIYDLPGPLEGETFDVVYTGRGAIGWLPDLGPWAASIASFLAPGGVFYIHEGHPVLWAVDEDQRASNPLSPRLRLLGRGDAHVPRRGVLRRPHGRGRRRVGARLEPLPGRDRDAAGRQRSADRAPRREARAGLARGLPGRAAMTARYGFPPDQVGTIPLMYSLRARKPG